MKKRILIVEDLDETRALLVNFLSGEGYETISARNGMEALPLFNSQKPDLVISDVMMPSMGGFELVERIKSENSGARVPIILLSAKDRKVTESVALDLGVDRVLEKPADLSMLIEAVDHLLGKA